MQTNNQYEMLKRCSQNKNLSEWNDWRKKNPGKDINLGGYNFEGLFLKNANFIKARVYDKSTDVHIDYTGEVNLEGANFKSANLENVWFGHAVLKESVFWYANARGADFSNADLEEANLSVANLQKCRFSDAILKNSRITSSHLEGANFINATLVGCGVRASVCDNATSFYGIKINKFSTKCYFTDFSATFLGSVRIDSGTRQLLEYNIRRMNWEDWYKKHKRLKWLARPLWWMSDYGISTWRIMLTFLVLAAAFALVYYVFGTIDYYLLDVKDYPGIVSNLFVLEDNPVTVTSKLVGDGFIEQQKIDLTPVPTILVPFRAVYFSIVTMTTLGFGDMYANAHRFWRGLLGHTLLGFQVILGYLLLGALVTRLNILFIASGPAGEFAKDKKERNKNHESNAG